MIILHDQPNSDLSHIQTIGTIEEGFSNFDYVEIRQGNGDSWIGQIVQPNMNISIIGNRLDPTILHGLRLMQEHQNVQSVESVQVFDILILGSYLNGQLQTPRLRPLPGAIVSRLNAEVTSAVIGLPEFQERENSTTNVIGKLLNAENVPLCISNHIYNYHVMVAGGTGSGKSNVAANLVFQATLCGKAVLIHDAKPDYHLVANQNTDPRLNDVWPVFAQYNIVPRGVDNLLRIGFYQRCDHNTVDNVVGFMTSDFDPEVLASYFFTGQTEQLQFEGFATVSDFFNQQVIDGHRVSYNLDDIIGEVQRRITAQNPQDRINEAVANAILRKVRTRRRNMPWLDSVGTGFRRNNTNRLQSSRLDSNVNNTVQQFQLADYIQQGRVILIDYSTMDEQSYALILSYFLRISQQYRKTRTNIGIVQLVDEAHRIFDNRSKYSETLAYQFERVMREGRSVDHSIILSLQNASQIPARVMNNLNTKIVMRQNSKFESDAATQTMGRDFSPQAMRLGTGQALVSIFESRATVLSWMAPSPFDLMRNDNTQTHN